ncbi:MAG: TolB family protein [Isosphaeraceae bacterium]
MVAKPVSSPTGMGSSLYKPSIVYSPDYNTLALGNAYYGIAIAKIDRASGKLSDVQLRVKGSADVGNSSAFSPDGTRLYYARGAYGYSGTPYQLDLTTGAETQLNPTGGFGGPKLAPDGRIYWTGNGKDALSEVQNPNASGTEVIFLLNDLYLNGGRAAFNLPAQTTAYTAYTSPPPPLRSGPSLRYL